MDNDSASLIKRPVEDIGSSADWFRRATNSHKCPIHPRSNIELALKRLDVLAGMGKLGVAIPWKREDRYEFSSDAIGADFLTKMIHIGIHARLSLPRERWRHLVGGDAIITRPGLQSQKRDRVWETILACAVTTFASEVTFAEPDVCCTFHGKQFGIAAKFPHSVKRLWTNVDKGVKQTVGRSMSGLIAVNVVDLFPVAETYNESVRKDFVDPSTAAEWVRDRERDWCKAHGQFDSKARKVRTALPKLLGVAFFIPGLLCLGGKPMPFFDTVMPLTWGEESIDIEFARGFLQACNSVLGFRDPSM